MAGIEGKGAGEDRAAAWAEERVGLRERGEGVVAGVEHVLQEHAAGGGGAERRVGDIAADAGAEAEAYALAEQREVAVDRQRPGPTDAAPDLHHRGPRRRESPPTQVLAEHAPEAR